MTDALLARTARRRSVRIAEEFPTVIEFLALSVAAGESILEALCRVARIGSGELAGELDRVVQRAAAGQPLALALDARNESKRRLIEAAATREVAMLVPLVFLIIPVRIAFAIFPGIFVLQVGL